MSTQGAEYYEGAWSAFHTFSAEDEARIAETLDLVPAGVTTFLDMGAGDGHLLRQAAGRGIRGVGLDLSFEAALRTGAAATVASAAATPFHDGSVDLVVACEVFEHLPDDVLRAALDEAARIAGRWVLVTVPNQEDRRKARVRCRSCDCVYNRYRHLRSFRPADVHALLPGFRVARTVELGPRVLAYPWFLAAAAERIGLVGRPGAPLCPQCGAAGPSDAPAATGTGGAVAAPSGGAAGMRRRVAKLARRVLPRARHRSWLAVLFERPPTA